jgi:nucleotide-binding universal stress UspA family protein
MHILLATDGSHDGNAGCRLLASAAHAGETRVTVLVVVPSRARVSSGLAAPDDVDDGDRNAVAAAIARESADLLRSAGYAVTEAVEHGDPAETIVQAAHRMQADLLVLGLQGVGRLRRFLLGSVSKQVAREAAVPVLLTREPSSLAHALVAIDGSPGSERALDTLGRVPPRLLDRVVLLQVNPAQDERDRFDAAAARLFATGVAVTRQTATGNEVEAIIAAAEREDATVIVLGASSAIVEGEPILGTTAAGVLDRAPCSVLIGR